MMSSYISACKLQINGDNNPQVFYLCASDHAIL